MLVSEISLSQLDGIRLEGLEFCRRTYALFEAIRAQPDGKSRLRMMPTDLEKKLLEELMPIAKYVQDHHRPGRYFEVKWHAGDQQFDAEVFQAGDYVQHSYYPAESFIEVTCASHPNDYLMRERLDTEGSAFGYEGLSRVKTGRDKSVDSVPTSSSIAATIGQFVDILAGAIEKKRAKTYPGRTVLIVRCTLNTGYLPSEWEQLARAVAGRVEVEPFAEIYFYDATNYFSCQLYPRPAG